MQQDIFQIITDRIVARLEQGVRTWSKPWRGGVSAAPMGLPYNIAGRAYRGANVPFLWSLGDAMGYAEPCWLTFNQAKAAGGHIRKGERGAPVFFWKFSTVRDKETQEDRQSVLLRVYTVFNIAQCEGVALPSRQSALTEFERAEAGEAILQGSGAAIHYGGDKAFYMPSRDVVCLPDRRAFKTADGFYSTAFHELGHWTGHPSRLDRKFGARFGDDAYAFEELVAELTAAFVCGSLGVTNPDREDHAAYLASWLKVLKADKRAIITAASQAQKAADLILQSAKAAEEPCDMAIAA